MYALYSNHPAKPVSTPPPTPTRFQVFQHNQVIESLEVQKNKSTGEYYSCLEDVQNTFPDAHRFKLNGVVLNFMRDASGQLYEPKRIAHYPDGIIDIVCAASIHEPLTPPESISDKSESHRNKHDCHSPPSPALLNDAIDLSIQTLSVQSENELTTRTLASLTVSPMKTKVAHPLGHHHTLTTAQETIVHSASLTTNQTSLLFQCDGWDDSQLPTHPKGPLGHTLHHLHELMRGQEKLQERGLQIIREHEESKERDKQILRNQLGMIDRLIYNQQRVDALLVQSYELHEYPIPRLFVIMPVSQKKWDPRKALVNKHRLHFLCECSDVNHRRRRSSSSDQSVFEEECDIPYKNRVHLTDHAGYELTRPNEFFTQYGAFVLGTLKILKHCMEVASAVAPVAGLAHGGLKAAIKGVSSFASDHLESINNSIGFLKDTLDEHKVNLGLGRDCDVRDQQDDHLQKIAALEGADLRRLHTFLRDNDKSTVLGNLYRITTDTGHVKWVCATHYGERYREANLEAFVHFVEASGGIYCPHYRKVTISLKSGTSARDFLRRLTTQGSTVNELDVTFDWKFRSDDLLNLVDEIASSNIQVLQLDLMDGEGSYSTRETLGLSRGKYHPLIRLLNNIKLRTVRLANLSLLGTRTPDLHATQMASTLRSFHFFGPIRLEDDARLARIVSSCSGLVDLRLWSGSHTGHLGQKLHNAIRSLKDLQSLHLQCMYRDFDLDSAHTTALSTPRMMKEIVGSTVVFDSRLLEETVQQSLSMLEVLVLESHNLYQHHFAMVPEPTPGSHPAPMPYELPVHGTYSPATVFSRLTHIDLFVRLTARSLTTLRTVLPFLRLIHFGSVHYTDDLLKHVNFATLKSLSIGINKENDLQPLQHTFIDQGQPCQIDLLKLEYYRQVEFIHPNILRHIPLTRLHLSRIDDEQRLCQLLEAVNFSRLQVLSIYECKYFKAAEAILTRRSGEFSPGLTVELDECSMWHYSNDMSYVGDPRELVTQLPARWVKYLGHVHRDEIHYRFLQPILPVTYY
ncbi:hypothetical protein BGZ95_009265 [Linnemannia exigua]|uniref:Uncharacterized protein n=1 Tax=Linnemannia exigua TaxID=604196 RepID=A0AAD4DEV8_9FUNG|nr:hypothetical protein BGZ95_009265 [Linnemannia exigua]